MIRIREEAFKYYFEFIEKRMGIFWAKYNNELPPWSEDETFLKYKFTNVYRVCDRVSQYLIKNVIEKNSKSSDIDMLLNILIFKIFNRIETWEYLISNYGEIRHTNFDVNRISQLLTSQIKKRPIFNGAYLMTGSHSNYIQYPSKHERWLKMVEFEFIKNKKLEKILQAKSMNEIFLILSSCPFIGDFLAYQYTIDFNYSSVINFSENSFVKAGIGSIRGIKKCFENIDDCSYEDIFRYTQDNFDNYADKYQINFKNLFDRELQLIDIQNCFCETDKYLRVKLPTIKVDNVRIKQLYKINNEQINYSFPKKWNLIY